MTKAEPFKVSDKEVEGMKIKKSPKDIQFKGNQTEIMHLMKHRPGPSANLA